MLQNEESPAEAVKSLSINIQNMKLEEVVFDESSIKRFSEQSPIMVEEAKKLDVGKVSNITEQNGCFIIFKVIARKDVGFSTFEEVRESCRRHLIDCKYEEMLKELRSQANIRIIHQLYNKVNAD